jgi:hypothetical protein
MGSDDLFYLKKAKKAKDFGRKKASQATYDRVLIVCEGGKTEPNYFANLRTDLGLNRVNVVIANKKGGLDPKALVQYALDELRKDPDFEHVYCVFDKDKHPHYGNAVDRIHSLRLNGGTVIHAITSVPCFEIWLLLHFIYTTHPYEAPLNDSNCALVEIDLKRYIPDYDKGSPTLLAYLDGGLGDAIDRAKLLDRFHKTSGTDNPSTKVYVIVEYLQALGKPK